MALPAAPADEDNAVPDNQAPYVGLRTVALLFARHPPVCLLVVSFFVVLKMHTDVFGSRANRRWEDFCILVPIHLMTL